MVSSSLKANKHPLKKPFKAQKLVLVEKLVSQMCFISFKEMLVLREMLAFLTVAPYKTTYRKGFSLLMKYFLGDPLSGEIGWLVLVHIIKYLSYCTTAF